MDAKKFAMIPGDKRVVRGRMLSYVSCKYLTRVLYLVENSKSVKRCNSLVVFSRRDNVWLMGSQAEDEARENVELSGPRWLI